MRFGLKDVNELPSMEEFEKLVAESFQSELAPAAEGELETGVHPAERDPHETSEIPSMRAESSASVPGTQVHSNGDAEQDVKQADDLEHAS